MPNDCWNYIMFTADAGDLTRFVRELKNFPQEHVIIVAQGLEAIRFKIWNPYHPNFEWLESLLTRYRSCWIKNEWIVTDGEAGTWIGTARNGEKVIRQLMWDDMSIDEAEHRFRTD